MAAHQIIAGALNHGEHVYGVGSVEGINFTVSQLPYPLYRIDRRLAI